NPQRDLKGKILRETSRETSREKSSERPQGKNPQGRPHERNPQGDLKGEKSPLDPKKMKRKQQQTNKRTNIKE
ncbi:MAG: hypothetical protein EGQ32_04420, partial [Prevotella sp.]|nr:hypothetical protein [Prevotella sp.]